MKLVYVILFIVGQFTVTSQVKLKSFYYKSDSYEMTSASNEDFYKFINFSRNYEIQVIEINAFTEGDLNVASAKKIAAARIDRFCDTLNIIRDETSINNYGSRRIEVNFNPRSWNRLDVYFVEFIDYVEWEYMQDSIQFVDTVVVVSINSDTIQIVEQKIEERKTGLVIDFNIPYVVPILFEGGTEVILPQSIKYLDELYDALYENRDVQAHIRGHVCCGKNKKISRKRAKVVYNYLKEKGIDKTRISFKGYSNKLPLVYPEKTEKDKDLNRRVDVMFSRIKLTEK